MDYEPWRNTVLYRFLGSTAKAIALAIFTYAKKSYVAALHCGSYSLCGVANENFFYPKKSKKI